MGKCDIALYGLGVMGSSLAKNLIRHGFRVAVYSKSDEERTRFAVPGKEDLYTVCSDVCEMMSDLKTPKIVFMMVTAGAAVDSVIEEVMPFLEKGDVLLDGGNSHFKDTTRRFQNLETGGICYLGVGVSGGEKGALFGPSMMAGGSLRGWEASRQILQAISAHYKGEPCCAYIAREGSGHYVKMVHNGIEYAILQLIAEIYYVMRYGFHLQHRQITDIFKSWKTGYLNSYLMDISVCVLEKMDEDGTPLVEKILDVAEQKGTGRWTLEDAIEREIYIPTIFEAVFARSFSGDKKVRRKGRQRLPVTGSPIIIDNYAEKLENALLLAIIISYAQGMSLIARASEENDWDIDLTELISVWRDGCIIRSELLSRVRGSLKEKEKNLLLTKTFSFVGELESSLRELVTAAEKAAIAIPALSSALHYYDYYRMEQMPVNFVQALRDCFGAHTYERVDREGHFHTEWKSEQE